jgi:Amt family ammonium transporter
VLILFQIFASHAIGGIVGNILTGLFAQASVASADGITTIPGGWLDHNYRQLGIQLADSVTGVAYSFVVTVSLATTQLHFDLTIYSSADYYIVDHALHSRPPPPM